MSTNGHHGTKKGQGYTLLGASHIPQWCPSVPIAILGGIPISDLVTNEKLMVFLKRNRTQKINLGVHKSRETFYTRNITKDSLRSVVYDPDDKRLIVKFVPIEQTAEVTHTIRIKCVTPTVLEEMVNFLSYQNCGGVVSGGERV